MTSIPHSQVASSGLTADITQEVAAALVVRLQRQTVRYEVRSLLRRVTGIKRVATCGMPLGSDLVARVKDSVHHFSGMETCGSGWVCPVCAAKIRFKRSGEVSRMVVAALQLGWGALFVTRTIPHSAEDTLVKSLSVLVEGRRYVSNDRQVKNLRRCAGYVGGIAAKEITYGLNGWHPHTHDIEFFERDVSLADFAALNGVYFEQLRRFYDRNGFVGLSRQHGVRVEQVQLGGDVLARYVAKLQEGADIRLHTAHELTRSDLKKGREGSLMPFDIFGEFVETGDMAALDLWHEFEIETRGKSVIRTTKGLRSRLLPNEKEKTDEELAAQEIGGVDVVRFAGWFYRKIAAVPGLEGKVLAALDAGGFAALVELLTVYHLDIAGGYYQIGGEGV